MLFLNFSTILGFIKVHGFEKMKINFGYSIANTTLFSRSMCGIPQKDYLNLVRNVDSDLPWTGFIKQCSILLSLLYTKFKNIKAQALGF